MSSIGDGVATAKTVVTATLRLSRALADRYAQDRARQGAGAWQQPRVVPYSGWLAALYESDITGDAPRALLAGAQERAIWEDIVASVAGEFDLISSSGLARNARDAWTILHAYRIPLEALRAAGTEDARVLAKLASAFESRCNELHVLDSARLADAIGELVRGGVLPAPRIVLAGFDDLSPQWRALCESITHAGGTIEFAECPRRVAHAVRTEFESPEQEWRAVAAWAHSRLEKNAYARTGIVVPDLASHRSAIERIFADTFFPGGLLTEDAQRTGPFRIHAAQSLAEAPMIHAALAVLDIAHAPLDVEAAGRLLQSPFLRGGGAEQSARARLDVVLRQQGGMAWSLHRLRLAAAHERSACPILAGLLTRVAEAIDAVRGKKGLAEWASVFGELLRVAGWPGERSPTVVEHELLEKWREALDSLASLDSYSSRCDAGSALGALRRMVSATPFEPRSREAPIEIMSPADSAGLDFDHLWITGLDDSAWPPAPRPDPLLPVALQRRHGVPRASAEQAFADSERMMHDWMLAADEVVLSWPRQSSDGECRPSRLIVMVPAISPGTLAEKHPTTREQSFNTRARESLIDEAGPSFAVAQAAQGGTSVLKDQSLCPFRAFAHHRLLATAIAEPVPGLNAMERGTIAHRVLAAIWGELRDADGLRSRGAESLRELVAAMSRVAIAENLRGRPHPGRVFVQVEEERVADLVLRWLELEATRPVAFRVVEREAKHAMNIGGLTIKGRIDRVDELADGSRLIIDYKTGKASTSKWDGERPDEPQLPAYACFGSDGPVSGAAFGALDRFAPKFVGVTRAGDMLPNVKPPGGKDHPAPEQRWDETLQTWRTTLERIASGFLAGDARVAPKNLQACATCDLHTLCRIHERTAEDDSTGEGDADD